MAKLTPHGRVPNGEGFGGFVRLDPMEVAGALGMGGLDARAYWWGMLKWAGDHAMLGRITRVMETYAYHASVACGKNPSDEQVVGLATLGILMGLHDEVCDRCNGSGQVAADTCGKCGGARRIPMSGRRKAEIAGIPRETWREGRWDEVAATLNRVTVDWDTAVDKHLRRYLKHDC
jgi:ribosomal protein L40E